MLVTEAGVTPSHISAPKNSPSIISFQVTDCALPELFRACKQGRRGCPWVKPLRGLIKNSTECCIKLHSLQTVLSSLFLWGQVVPWACVMMKWDSFPPKPSNVPFFGTAWIIWNVRVLMSGLQPSSDEPTSTVPQKIISNKVWAMLYTSALKWNLKFHEHVLYRCQREDMVLPNVMSHCGASRQV